MDVAPHHIDYNKNLDTPHFGAYSFLLNITKIREDGFGLLGGGFLLVEFVVPWFLPRSPLLAGNAKFLVPDFHNHVLEACGWPPVAGFNGARASRGT